MLGLTAAHDRDTHGETRSVLDRGVVAVHVSGVPEASLAPLKSDGVVVARLAGREIVIACADLARVTEMTCPLPDDQDVVEYNLAEQLFVLPYAGASSADYIFGPEGFSEPGTEAATLPIQTLFIQTDGTPAAQERIRTLAAVKVPISRSKTSEDLAARRPWNATGLETILPAAMVFVL